MASIKFKKCYFLAPTRYFKPDKRIRLGNIIIDSSAPDQALNTNIPIIKTTDIEETEESEGEVHESLNTVFKSGVSTSFLQMLLGAGVDAKSELSKTETNSLDWDKVIVQEFGPSTAFLQAAIEDSGVNKYLQEKKKTFFGERPVKLYMITGVKIASGSKYCTDVAKKRGIFLHAAVDATQLGIPGSLGGDLDVNQEHNFGGSSKVQEPFVLGFRLKRLNISPQGNIKMKDYVDGAYLGDDGQPEQEVDIPFLCTSLTAQNVTGSEFGQEEIKAQDYDGKEILVVDPSET